MDKTILALCHAALEAHSDTSPAEIVDDHFRVFVADDDWTVSIDEADVEDDEEGNGNLLTEMTCPMPVCIDYHTDVLDVCLAALRNSPIADQISDVTTDGDHKDCEAIFKVKDEGYMTLKVR